MRIPDPGLIDDVNPEWTEETFRRARPAAELLPEVIRTNPGLLRQGTEETSGEAPL